MCTMVLAGVYIQLCSGGACCWWLNVGRKRITAHSHPASQRLSASVRCWCAGEVAQWRLFITVAQRCMMRDLASDQLDQSASLPLRCAGGNLAEADGNARFSPPPRLQQLTIARNPSIGNQTTSSKDVHTKPNGRASMATKAPGALVGGALANAGGGVASAPATAAAARRAAAVGAAVGARGKDRCALSCTQHR